MSPLGTQAGTAETKQHKTPKPLILRVARRGAVSAHEGRGTKSRMMLTKVHQLTRWDLYATSTRVDEVLSSDEGALLTHILIVDIASSTENDEVLCSDEGAIDRG